MITLYTLFPDRLNLNGDQGNLLVLKRRIEWFGAQVKVVAIESEQDIDDASKEIASKPESSFVLTGHGSIAAMRSLQSHSDKVRSLMQTCIENSVAGIAVGSSVDWYVLSDKSGDRTSEFRSAEIEYPEGSGIFHTVVGYLNSDAKLEPLAVQGNFIFTLLHGPVLAKSSSLADQIIQHLGVNVADGSTLKRISDYEKEAIATAMGERN